MATKTCKILKAYAKQSICLFCVSAVVIASKNKLPFVILHPLKSKLQKQSFLAETYVFLQTHAPSCRKKKPSPAEPCTFLQKSAVFRRGRIARSRSDPRNRNHKSLAIANHNFEVASFCRRNRNEIAVLQVFRSRSDFFELRLQSLAICDSKSLRFGSLRARSRKKLQEGCSSPKFPCINFFSKYGTSRPKPRDIPATPCLKQQKKATCIKFLSGISRRLP